MNTDSEVWELKDEGLAARCREAARRGLNFLVRHQMTDFGSAEHGRFAFIYRFASGKIDSYTTNWTTGVAVEAMLLGYQVFRDERYLEAARRGVGYIRSLQEFSPLSPRVVGTFHEETPQSKVFHPRDALTAAWALLDWSEVTGDSEARQRAVFYADWLIREGMDAGYPRWTVSYETFDADPRWYGSFHSGSAFFFARMHAVTGEERYLTAMKQILEVYNHLMLSEDGCVTVIVDIERQTPMPAAEVPANIAPVGWIRMHEYNDDFGALANVEAYRLTGNRQYLEAAERFLRNMVEIQRRDGGFGPAEYSVPSAGGSVLLELLAAEACGSSLPVGDAVRRAVDYVLALQVLRKGAPEDGAFRGFTNDYTLDPDVCNVRAGGYAILALLRLSGAKGPIYFPSVEKA